MIDLSLESINYVGKDLYTKLSEMVHFLRVDGTYSTEAIKQTMFTDIVKRHTGMNVTLSILDFGNQVNAFAVIPPLNRNHPFVRMHEWLPVNSTEGTRILAMGKGKNLLGTVNLATGTVGGFYSEFPLSTSVYLGLMKNTSFTPGEVASIILHELGHLYTYFQYINTIGYGGLITSIAAKEIAGARTKDERRDSIRTATELLGIEDGVDLDENIPQSEEKVQVVLFRNYISRSVSVTGTSQYDYRNCEQLADQFSTKHGAGRDLVTGLDKMFTMGMSISKRSTFAFVSVETCKLIMFVLGIASGMFIPVALITLILAAPGGYKGYDDPEARVRLIRQQTIASIQDVKRAKTLDPKVLDVLIEDIEVIDEILKTIKDRRTLVQLFWQSLPGPSGNLRKQEIAAKQLEELMFNDLIYQSTRFEQLTK